MQKLADNLCKVFMASTTRFDGCVMNIVIVHENSGFASSPRIEFVAVSL